jgi:tetratricopeptide (TPR) repeat protein
MLESASRQGDALAAYEAAVEAVPGDAALWGEFALYQERQGKTETAVAVLERALERLPRMQALRRQYAETLFKLGRHEQAAKAYEELLKGSKTPDVAALNNLAILYTDALSQVDRAVSLAERAYSLVRRPEVADTLGWALLQRGKPEDLERAEPLLAEAARKLSSASVHYHYGALLLRRGRAAQGKAELQRALAAGPFPQAEQARALLR